MGRYKTRPPYKTVGKLLNEFFDLKNETGGVNGTIYKSNQYWIIYITSHVKITSPDLKVALKKAIAYVHRQRFEHEIKDGRFKKFVLKETSI